jgi:DNA-binding NarL/FixJ family response regulator
MSNKHKIIIADDHVLFADSLKIVISIRARDMEVVGVAYNGAEAIDLVEKLKPDIVLMDVRMPKIDGVEATRIIRERHSSVKIMMLTTFADDKYVYEAMRNGAEAYLLKDISPDELIDSIRATLNGTILISPSVASKVISQGYAASQQGSQERAEEQATPRHFFSERERQILKLIAEGLDNRSIAETLFLAEQTVKNRISDIYSRLGVHNRVQAIRKMDVSLVDKDPQDSGGAGSQ